MCLHVDICSLIVQPFSGRVSHHRFMVIDAQCITNHNHGTCMGYEVHVESVLWSGIPLHSSSMTFRPADVVTVVQGLVRTARSARAQRELQQPGPHAHRPLVSVRVRGIWLCLNVSSWHFHTASRDLHSIFAMEMRASVVALHRLENRHRI